MLGKYHFRVESHLELAILDGSNITFRRSDAFERRVVASAEVQIQVECLEVLKQDFANRSGGTEARVRNCNRYWRVCQSYLAGEDGGCLSLQPPRDHCKSGKWDVRRVRARRRETFSLCSTGSLQVQ